MLDRLLRFFASGPDLPPETDPLVVRRRYRRWRPSVFLSITFGYGLFYVCRINFSVVKKPLLDGEVLTATQMGMVGTSLLLAYAIGKLVNGFLTDRANVRWLMSLALLGSALLNLLLGFNAGFFAFVLLWGLNGWLQSCGSAPSIVAISNWFTSRERGTCYGIWSCSHGIGEVLTFAVTAAIVAAFGWRWGFWAPGILCALGALVLTRTLADRPQAMGLPPVHLYKGEPAPPQSESQSVGAGQLEVLRNPAVWVLGLSSATMYVGRYGIDNWGVLFLQEAKGFSLERAAGLLAISSIAQIAGSLTSGWVSDRFFDSKRNVPTLLAQALEIAALLGLWLAPPGVGWIHAACIFAFGFALGHLLVYVGGLMAVDIAPPRAVGATSGLVGMFSYLGAAIQDTASGTLLDAGKTIVDGRAVYSFDGAFALWVGASAVSMLLVLMLTLWWARLVPAPEAPQAQIEGGS